MGSSRNKPGLGDDVLRCAVCGAVMVQGRGPKRRTCSARCRQAAQRQRDAARLAGLKATARAAELRRAGLRAAQAAEAAPSVMALAPTPPAAAAPVDPIEQVRQAAAGLDEAVRAAADAGVRIDAIETAASLATLGNWVRRHTEATTGPETSRDEPAGATPAAAAVDAQPAATSASPARAAEAEPAPEPVEEPDPARKKLQTLLARGIQPHAQRLSRKKAQAIIDAAHLVRSPDHAETNRWLVTDGTTVLGTVSPTYGGTSRSGRTGWQGHVNGMRVGPYDHRPTRDAAALDVLDAWRRIVTANPHTAISLFSDRT